MGLYDRDYMRVPLRDRGPSGAGGPQRRWVPVIIVVVLVVIAGWWVLKRVTLMMGPGFDEEPRSKLLQATTVDLGQFEVVSGEVAICDPASARDLVLKGETAIKVGNVATGPWQAWVIRHVIDTPDQVRCAELLAFPVALPLPEAPVWQEIHAGIDVESGQAGFFDWRHFRSPAVVSPDHAWQGTMVNPQDPWYSLCCEVTLHGHGAGVIPHGVVSSSGWGDGGYPVYALRDGQGTVIGLRLVFIFSDEYESDGK